MNISVMKKVQRILIIVIVISFVLLLITGSIYAYQRFFKPNENPTVVLPDNVLTNAEHSSVIDADNNKADAMNSKTTATKIELFKTQDINNEPFNMRNIVPGASETKRFAVKVFHQGAVTLNFSVKESENTTDSILSSGLRAKLIDLSSNKELNDDIIENLIGKSFSVTIPKNAQNQTERYYEVLVYLPTEAGNEYQRTSYWCDFVWSAYGDLDKIPPTETGYDMNRIIIPAIILSVSLLVLLILLILRRKDKSKK